MAKRKFPRTLYLHRDGEGTDDEYWMVEENAKDFGAGGEPVRIGRYQFIEELDVITKVELHTR